jgi:hypothetical protein
MQPSIVGKMLVEKMPVEKMPVEKMPCKINTNQVFYMYESIN